MTTNRTVKFLALAVLLPMLIMAFAVAPAQAKSSNDKLVDNVKIDAVTIDLYQVPLTDEQLAMLNEIVPLQTLLDSGVQYLYIDGTAHVNLMVSEKKDNYDVNLHLAWHGTIALLDQEKNVVVSVVSKNVQLVVHATIPKSGDLSQSDLWLHFHTNSALTMGEGTDSSVELKAHIILSFADGQFDMVKVQLPQFADVALF